MSLSDRIRERAREVRQKTKRDIRAAEREVSSAADRREQIRQAAAIARSRGQKAAEAIDDIDIDQTQSATTRERSVADRAESAGQARAPIESGLDPMGDPRSLEAFARAGGSRSESDANEGPAETSSEPESMMDFAAIESAGMDSMIPFGGESDDAAEGNSPGWFGVDNSDAGRWF